MRSETAIPAVDHVVEMPWRVGHAVCALSNCPRALLPSTKPRKKGVGGGWRQGKCLLHMHMHVSHMTYVHGCIQYTHPRFTHDTRTYTHTYTRTHEHVHKYNCKLRNTKKSDSAEVFDGVLWWEEGGKGVARGGVEEAGGANLIVFVSKGGGDPWHTTIM